jgi:hypothetical protein
MVRKILVPEKNTVVVELPDDYIGKEIELLMFPINDSQQTTAQDMTMEEVKTFFNRFNVDMTDFKFNRDEVNEAQDMMTGNLKQKLEGYTFDSNGYKFNRDDANDYD